MGPAKIQKNFERISKKLENVSKEIESMMPRAIVRKTSTFGNSSHVVLSKELIDKEVGVIILGEKEERYEKQKK